MAYNIKKFFLLDVGANKIKGSESKVEIDFIARIFQTLSELFFMYIYIYI